MLGQAEQGPHGYALRMKRFEPLRVVQQQIESHFGIGRIVLGPTGLEGDTILCQRRWVDWKEHEEVVLLKRIDDRAFGQFKGNRNPAAKSLIQGFRPFIDAGHLVRNAGELALIAASSLQTDVVLGIAPIDADIGRKWLGTCRFHVASPKVIHWILGTCLLAFCEGNIVSR